jgi:hypothetical protein
MIQQQIVWVETSHLKPIEKGFYVISFDGIHWNVAFWSGKDFRYIFNSVGTIRDRCVVPHWWAKIRGPEEK